LTPSTAGHGSTRALLAAAGGAVVERYDFDAYGGLLASAGAQSDPAQALTPWLFAGDGEFDPDSGLTYHLRRWRQGFLFTQPDPSPGTIGDPESELPYPYAIGDPVGNADPTGRFALLDVLGGSGGGAAGEVGAGATAETVGVAATDELEQGVAVFEGVEMGIMNLNFQPDNVNLGAAFLVGFTSGMGTEELKFAGVPCSIANAVGGAVLDFGNNYLANGSAAFSFGGLMEAITMGVIAGLTSGCFEAGTPVLLGSGTEEAINDIQVGQRVATDGGVANSPDGKTAAADPNATAVNRQTWREVTIDAGDWQVEALEPLSWIRSHRLTAGSAEALSDYVDLTEMGAPVGLVGTVESIAACPRIAKGPGRAASSGSTLDT
jgi:hypothetical protein